MMLREEVARKYRRQIKTSADFSQLSEAVAESGAGYLSQSTLKRLWGYVKDTRRKHRSTLDILSRYIGYNDFAAYCSVLDKMNISDSDFAIGDVLNASELEAGSMVEVFWKPDRTLTLRALEDMTFEVMACQNTRVAVGSTVRCMSFVTGQPLLLDLCSEASGEKMVYIAGKQEGIIWRIVESNRQALP